MAWKRKARRKAKDGSIIVDALVEEKQQSQTVPPLQLKVLCRDDVDGMDDEMDAFTSPFAYVSKSMRSGAAAGSGEEALAAAVADGRGFIFVRNHAQFILRVREHAAVPAGCIVMTTTQMRTMEVCKQCSFEWHVFDAGSASTLRDLSVEVRPLRKPAEGTHLELDARAVTQAVSKYLFGHVVTLHEIFTVSLPRDLAATEAAVAARKAAAGVGDHQDAGEAAAGGEAIEAVADVPDVAADADAASGAAGGVLSVASGSSTSTSHHHLVCQVTETNALGDDDDELLIPDTFRGVVDAQSSLYVGADTRYFAEAFGLRGVVTRLERPVPSDLVHVTTSDDEYFPVKKRLLLPCIALAGAVLDKDVAAPKVAVDVDCCTFDRVLIYLEHEAGRRAGPYTFDLVQAQDLADASRKLGCRGLQELAEEMLNIVSTQVRPEGIPFEEVRARNERSRSSRAKKKGKGKKEEEEDEEDEEKNKTKNKQEKTKKTTTERTGEEGKKSKVKGEGEEEEEVEAEVLVIIDGMVFDVTRWLPQHPGGSIIIPEQALNVETVVLFELYHASRQSFQFLRQFYIGDLRPEDVSKVPPPEDDQFGKGTPSAAFLEQLRSYTTWRVRPKPKVEAFKSF